MIQKVDHRGLAEAVAKAQRSGLRVATCPTRPATKLELIDSISAAIDAPSGTGQNWDAIVDMLSEYRGLICLPLLSLLDARDLDTLERVIAAAEEKNPLLRVTAPS